MNACLSCLGLRRAQGGDTEVCGTPSLGTQPNPTFTER